MIGHDRPSSLQRAAAAQRHRRTISLALVVVGLGVTAAWCVLVLPALIVAESGAGLTLRDRGMIAAPLAVGGALLVLGGKLAGQLGTSAGRAARLARVAIVIGTLAVLAAIAFVIVAA